MRYALSQSAWRRRLVQALSKSCPGLSVLLVRVVTPFTTALSATSQRRFPFLHRMFSRGFECNSGAAFQI